MQKTRNCVNRYPNSDLFRLLLALEVVFVHTWFTVDPKFNWDGFLMAVPCFLAISGFLVLQSYEFSKSWLHFVWKRALRVLPAVIVSIILSGITFGLNGVYYSILNWLSGGLYDNHGEFNNGPLWSLAWEEFAYFCLMILWLAGAYKKTAYIWLLLVGSVVMVWQTANLSPHYRIITFLAPSFLVGNLMYLYRNTLLSIHRIVPWVILFLAINFKHTATSTLLAGALNPIVQAFAVVWVSIAGIKAIPFEFPDISYGIYVYHFPVIAYLSTTFGIGSVLELFILSFLILIPLCLLSWYFIEKPILQYKNSAFNQKNN